jgi:hypothetical protein
MDLNKTNMADLGLEYAQWPITHVRIHRTDGKWLVEYRRKPKYYIDQWWWFNDGTYVDYTEAQDRAAKLLAQGYVLYVRYRPADVYVVDQNV